MSRATLRCASATESARIASHVCGRTWPSRNGRTIPHDPAGLMLFMVRAHPRVAHVLRGICLRRVVAGTQRSGAVPEDRRAAEPGALRRMAGRCIHGAENTVDDWHLRAHKNP